MAIRVKRQNLPGRWIITTDPEDQDLLIRAAAHRGLSIEQYLAGCVENDLNVVAAALDGEGA